ncbi:hypothetical protein D3C76_630480 [compost metagenome]
MRIDASEVLKNAFNNLIQRNASQLQLQDFINHSRRYHADNPTLLTMLDELENKIPKERETIENI